MEITEELMEQTYQFCYRRLSNPDDARDLAQDILCEALQAIARGRRINNFSGWYWKMARNRYAVMINRLNQKPTEYAIDDFLDCLVCDSEEAVDALILEEDISRMHATIARMAKIHREILVQYFIRERPIKEIAGELNIPVGTVKRRLFDAKHEVKKEMIRMPKVTELSYAPCELELWTSQAWDDVDVFRDLLGKQILASCYRQSYSVPELSELIQVASVYLEDKMHALEHIGLLKRDKKNRYLTNFIILPQNTVTAMLQDLEDVHMKMCETSYEIFLGQEVMIRDVDFYGKELPETYLNRIFLPMMMSWLGNCCVEEYQKHIAYQQFSSGKGNNFDCHSDRIMGQILSANEKPTEYQRKAANWRSLMKEIDTLNRKRYIVYNNFCSEPFSEEDMFMIHGNNVELLCELAKNPAKSLSVQEEVSVGVLIKQGFVKKKGERYYPQLAIFTEESFYKIRQHIKEQMMPLAQDYKDRLIKIINAHLFSHIREDLLEQYYNYIIEIFMLPVSTMVWWGNEKKLFVNPDNPDSSPAGIFLVELK